MEKQWLKMKMLLFSVVFCLFAEDWLHLSALSVVTYTLVALVSVLSKRMKFLLTTPNPSRHELRKISLVYFLAIVIECYLIFYLSKIYETLGSSPSSHTLSPNKIADEYKKFYSIFLFENIMSCILTAFSYLKYTLSLWCYCTGNDFHLKFLWYSSAKYWTLLAGFVVVLTCR
eukprot:TRINITY_DN13070_c0_g4_i1.p3 TRINITY_DN13070_c0_g4~~TRINITY_DN13070_c0_g4_i1.p3  ORF type:complete len:173 (+),score=30.47 TRINITY_DN13070_c0_g4_i1:352-870(+)